MSDLNIDNTIRAILVGAGEDRYIEELGHLADTLGLVVVDTLEQNRRDGAGYLGKGKREELADMVGAQDVEMVVTDDELTASQARVLERSCGASVVDRTELIIQIFEAHAKDAASRLEVELADLEYRLPRVKGRNPALSRLGGGVGGGRVTRGPGEQQLEYDRRAIRRRIESINRKLQEEKNAREVRGARLYKGDTPTVALVGYTNAGKTTILNSISGAQRSTADRLFETLETTTRLVTARAADSSSKAQPDFVVTDTVGFIRKLPTQLVHSFAGTLQSANNADIVVLCADASSKVLSEEISTVNEILSSLERTILCLNKADLLTSTELAELTRDYPSAVIISADNSTGELLDSIHEAISLNSRRVQILIPHIKYGLASRLYSSAEIHSSKDTEKGLWLDVSLPRSSGDQYDKYRTN
ncbi:MAG: GTPase HflX [Rubrobacteraceae bacterium]